MSILDGPEQLIGSQVGDFVLIEVLGAGGMSVVYKGRHALTNQLVAVKVLPPELALHRELKLRFVEEARALAMLEHPNIVHLINFTEDGAGRVCLLMQFVDGVTLEKMIHQQGRLPPKEAVRICIEVAKALEYAHTHGIVHRDMKPSNVLVRSDGAVKVTDFGIAKIIGSDRLTEAGQTMGTVRYMSPEQVRGKEVDARSDIYSLGVTLYEALNGDTPFTGDTHFDIMQKHLTDPPPSLRGKGVDVSGDLEDVLRCALEKAIDSRFADAAQFRSALECVVEGARPGTAKRPTLPRARKRRSAAQMRTVGLALLAVLAAGTAGTVIMLRHRAPVAATGDRPPHGAPTWPPPHALLRTLKIVVDERYRDDSIRVIATSARDPRALRDEVLAARKLFPAFLAKEKVAVEVPLRPLNLAVVSAKILNRADLWPDSERRAAAESEFTTRYFPVDATLYVADAPGFEKSDLPYGLALHFCAPIKSLSNDQIEDLAERFARFYARPKAAR